MRDYELEADLENKLCTYCKAQGWLYLKLILVSLIGFPDRTIITRRGVVFMELKRRKKAKRSPQQEYWVRALAESGGCEAYFVNTFDDALAVLQRHL